MYFAKQVSPEWQQDDLFYQFRDKNGHYGIKMNDEYFENNVIIDGNREFMGIQTDEYEKIMKISDVYYEFDKKCYWSSVTEFINWYFHREKPYNTREIHRWKQIFEKFSERWDEKDIMCEALELLTGKKWREITLRGCMQREWQTGYVSEDITDKDVEYLEMCYFNTGVEYIVYETEEDFNNEENGCSYYVEDADDLRDRLCESVRIFEFTGYSHIPQYQEVQ